MISKYDRTKRLHSIFRRTLEDVLRENFSTTILDSAVWVIVDCQFHKDFSFVRVFVSVHDPNPFPILDFLNLNRHKIHMAVSRSLHMKRVPKISFVLDNQVEQNWKVQAMLHKLEQDSSESSESPEV